MRALNDEADKFEADQENEPQRLSVDRDRD